MFCMAYIICWGYPTEIPCFVVVLVPVDVIHLRQSFRVRVEGFGDQTVNSKTSSACHILETDSSIPE